MAGSFPVCGGSQFPRATRSYQWRLTNRWIHLCLCRTSSLAWRGDKHPGRLPGKLVSGKCFLLQGLDPCQLLQLSQGHQVDGVISILQENIESQRGAEICPSFKASRWCSGNLHFRFKGGQEGSTMAQARKLLL